MYLAQKQARQERLFGKPAPVCKFLAHASKAQNLLHTSVGRLKIIPSALATRITRNPMAVPVNTVQRTMKPLMPQVPLLTTASISTTAATTVAGPASKKEYGIGLAKKVLLNFYKILIYHCYQIILVGFGSLFKLPVLNSKIISYSTTSSC